MKKYLLVTFLVVFTAVLLGCKCPSCARHRAGGEFTLAEVTQSHWQWTGIAVARDGRMFVNFPRWSANVPVSMGEITQNGIRPYPNKEWNTWDSASDPKAHFICVQSVYIDDKNFLWVLDPASPNMAGVVPNGPKLLKIDLAADKVIQRVYFNSSVAPVSSYLNDVRIDTGTNTAYITESGSGAIIVADLSDGSSRRVLADHPSTKSENIKLVIDGKTWTRDGQIPQIHADGIAIDPQKKYLYYHALTASTLYRVPLDVLRFSNVPGWQLAQTVENMGRTGPCDGMIFGNDGVLYLTGVDNHSIKRFVPGRGVEVVLRDDRLQWPDSFAISPKGRLLVTTSQINVPAENREPFRIYMLK